MSRGFLSEPALRNRLANTVALKDMAPEEFHAVQVAGGTGAAVDLYPSPEVTRILEHFWATGKVVGTICHGSIALTNNVKRVAGRTASGDTLAEDFQAEDIYGPGFIPNFPPPTMEHAGIEFVHVEPRGVKVVVDGQLVTGQNQQSASEYSIQFQHLLTGVNPVTVV